MDETDTPAPRRVAARRLRSLALIGTAATLAGTVPAAAWQAPAWQASSPARLWLASAEGGEAGEGGGPKMAADTGLFTALGELQGQLRIAMAMAESGHMEDARAHAEGPDDDLYQILDSEFAEHKLEGFEPELGAWADAVDQGKPLAEIKTAYAAVEAKMAEVMALAPHDHKAVFQGLTQLARSAAEAYGRGVADGKVTDLDAYQDAWGDMQALKGMARGLVASSDAALAAGAQAVLTEARATDAAFGGPLAKGEMTADPSILYAAAARVEFAGLKVK